MRERVVRNRSPIKNRERTRFHKFLFFSQIISKLKLSFFQFPVRHLLSSLSQLVTLPFQSQVCLSKSKASPLGHVICFSPDLVHLGGRQPTAKMFIFERNKLFFYRTFCFFAWSSQRKQSLVLDSLISSCRWMS